MEHDTIIGRADLLAALASLVEQAARGVGQVVIVSGEQGIGKTTLLRHASAASTAAGLRPLIAHGDVVSQAAPYAQWVTLLEAAAAPDVTSGAIARLRTEHGAADSGWSVRDLVVGVVDTLLTLAARQPLLIALDDLHLLDPASLDVLAALAHRVSNAAILLVVAYRDDLGRSQLGFAQHLSALLAVRGVSRMPLHRLTRENLAQVVHLRYGLGSQDSRRLERYLETVSHGNPLVASEVLVALQATGVLTRQSEETGAGTLGALPQHLAPPVLRDIIAQRLQHLTDRDRVALHSAAVIGQAVDLDLWQHVSGTRECDLEEVIERVCDAHILRESDDRQGYAFTHPVLRDVLYDDIILPRRRRIHREIAEHLALRRNPEVYAIAHHFSVARDPRAVDWLVRAGRLAEQTYALVTATELYEEALGLLNFLGRQDATVVELLFRLALVQRYADPFRARSYLDEALELVRGIGASGLAAGIRHYRALMRCWTGDVEGGLPELAEAVDDIGELDSSDYADLSRTVWFGARERGEHRGTLIDWYREVGRLQDALSGFDGSVTDPTRPPKGDGQVRISPPGDRLSGIADALAQAGRPDEARRVYAAARPHFEALNHHHSAGWIYLNELRFVGIPYDTDDLDRLQRLADGATAAWERSSAAQFTALPRLGQLPLLYLRGAWQEVRELSALSRSAPPTSHGYLDPVPWLANIAFHTGDRATLLALLADVLPKGPDTAPGSTLFTDAMEVQHLVARMALEDDDSATAADWIEAHARWIAWSGARRYEPGLALLRAMHAQQDGDVVTALEQAGVAEAAASAPRQPLMLVAAQRMRGALLAQQGDLAGGEALLRDALDLADRVGSPLEQALSLTPLAHALARAGRVADAIQAIDRARVIALQLRATPLLQQLDGLRQQMRLGSTGDPFAQLTPRELEVLQHLVRGQTSREIAWALHLSVRTTERHISNIYAKLGVTQRAEAIAFAVGRGIS
jgi:DNA-binding CsgD family transcriptional regulator